VRRAAKIDANQAEIVAALRKAGYSVQSLAAIGKGCPDLLVGKRNRNFLLEIKDADGKLTPQQWDWHFGWKGDVRVARTAEEALAFLK
jgi:hypothetical protein